MYHQIANVGSLLLPDWVEKHLVILSISGSLHDYISFTCGKGGFIRY